MDEWAWLSAVDPVAVERERFRVTARALKRREGTQLGMLYVTPKPKLKPKRVSPEVIQVERAAVLHGRIRTLTATLKRERREHARRDAWNQKVINGHLRGGRFSLEDKP